MAVNSRHLRRIGLAVIALLAGARFILFPLSEYKSDMAAENRLLAAQLAKQKGLWAHRDTLKSNLERAGAQLTGLSKHFPVIKAADAKKFQLEQQKRVENRVKKAGIRINTLTWLPLTSPFFHHIPVKIIGEGPPAAFYDVVRALESGPEFVTLNTFSLRRYGNRQEVRGELVITFYALEPEVGASKVAS